MAQSLATMKGQGGSVATTDPVRHKVQLLEKRKELLGSGASESIKVDREIRAAAIMLANSHDLQDSTPETFYTAVSNAVNSGIGLCNGRGYLVAYKGKCSFVPGWKGLIDLVARTGRATAWTGVVYKGDNFAYELGADPFLRHKPEGDSDNWKDATHVYAIGRIKGQDFPIVECWTVAKVIKHLNKYNKVGVRHYALKDDNNMEMYARKIVLLQAMKYLPSSQDTDKAIAAEYAAEDQRDLVLNGDFVYVPDEPQGGNHQQTDPLQETAVSQPQGGNGAPPQANQRQAGTMDERSPFDKLKQRLETLTDVDMLDVESDLIREIEDADKRDILSAIYKERREELSNPTQQKSGQGTAASRRNGMSLE